MQTARTCCMSVTPCSTFSMPSCFSVRMPSSSAVREHLGDARVLLDQLLHRVGADQQLVQADAALVAGAAALVAAHRRVERELALVVAVMP